MKRAYIIWVAALCSMNAFGQTRLESNNGETSFERIHSIPVEELWNATAPVTVEVGVVVVELREFDSEAPPLSGHWRGCGLVVVGTSDVGVKPVAFRVWSRSTCDMTIKQLGAKKGRSTFLLGVNKKIATKIEVINGISVRVDGTEVGNISE
jgi:hypothetical protein